MNLALGAFILTLLFLPAVSFRLAINRQENLRGLLNTFSLTDTIWVFSMVPIVLHVLLIGFIFFIGYDIKFDLILNILYSNKDFPIKNHAFTIDILCFLAYCFLAILAGYFLGRMFNTMEKRNKYFSRLLGLGNEWYKLITVPDESENGDKVDLIHVDVLSNTKESTILYSGIVHNYYYQPKSTELEYLVLKWAIRRELHKEHVSDRVVSEQENPGTTSYYSAEPGTPIKIPGQYFIIPMKEVLNVNVSHIKLGGESISHAS